MKLSRNSSVFSGSSFGRKCFWGCGSGRCCFCLLPTVPPHSHTRNTLAHTHITYTLTYNDFRLSNIFILPALLCWLKIFSVKNVEKSKTTKTEGNNNNKNNKNKKKNMVRPRRPPVFHNFSFLFIYTIRYIFVFMCRSPTDLRFASATIGHRDSSILVAASAACRHIFFVYPFPHIFMTFPPLIFTNFHQVFHPVWTSAFAANETNHDLIVSAPSLQLP